MTHEVNVIGPPGCGKTTWLSRQVELAVEKYGADGVMVCSFTKAAVAELNRRNLPIPTAQLGTLHALAYRTLGNPTICETGKYLSQFGDEYPRYAMEAGTRQIDDGYNTAGKKDGDKALAEYSRLRALRRPRDLWPQKTLDFAKKWEGFKNDTFTRDFTDLIDDCVKEQLSPGFDAVVGFVDEFQDLTPLEAALARQWGQGMEKLVLVGDPDQCIYSFKGAQADLGINPDVHVMTLKQSYRVSQAVHGFSESIINLISPHERLQREYFPTSEVGDSTHLHGDYRRPEQWFPLVQQHLDQYQTVMLLASCSYMVAPIVKFLRREAIPFANVYRRQRRDWNPLAQSKKQTSVAARVQAYMTGWRRDPATWTGEELSMWLPLGSGIVKRGGREKLMKVPGYAPPDLLAEVMPLGEMKGPEWILDHLAAAYRFADYQIRVGVKDWAALETEPALSIGTIHSVKGGEADVVFLFPDISPEAAKAMRHDEIGPTVRMFYVGATRARTTLYLGQSVNPDFRLRWPA